MERPRSTNFTGSAPTDPWTGIRLTRLGVALNGLVLALEAAAYHASDHALLDLAGWSALAEQVPARLNTCFELLGAVRMARLPADIARAEAMREAYETLRTAYDDFRNESDRSLAARALLRIVRSTKGRADAWSE